MTQTKRRTKNLAQTPEIDKITLADGKEYELAPLDVNIMADMEEEFDKPWDDIMMNSRAKHIRHLLYLRMKSKYPNMDEEKLGSLINIPVLVSLNENVGKK